MVILVVVVRGQLNPMTLEVFWNLNDSMILLLKKNPCHLGFRSQHSNNKLKKFIWSHLFLRTEVQKSEGQGAEKGYDFILSP